MSILFTTGEMAACAIASRVLLTPDAFDRVSDWRTASRQCVAQLLHADASVSLLFMRDEPIANVDRGSAPLVALATGCATPETGVFVRRHAPDVTPPRAEPAATGEACATAAARPITGAVADAHAAVLDDPVDATAPTGAADTSADAASWDAIGMAVRSLHGLPAASLHFYRRCVGEEGFSARAVAMLRLLLPSFDAGVQALARGASHTRLLADVLDASRQALLLLDAEGRPLHATPLLEEWLAGEDEPTRIHRVMDTTAAMLTARLRDDDRAGPPTSIDRELATSRRRYLLHGCRVGTDAEGRALSVLLRVEPHAEPPVVEELRMRFRLTPREADVARLAAERYTAREIAGMLHITGHTARRHLEHVYAKTGVHSRSGLAVLVHRLSAASYELGAAATR